jgi:hypothetical protein
MDKKQKKRSIILKAFLFFKIGHYKLTKISFVKNIPINNPEI